MCSTKEKLNHTSQSNNQTWFFLWEKCQCVKLVLVLQGGFSNTINLIALVWRQCLHQKSLFLTQLSGNTSLRGVTQLSRPKPTFTVPFRWKWGFCYWYLTLSTFHPWRTSLLWYNDTKLLVFTLLTSMLFESVSVGQTLLLFVEWSTHFVWMISEVIKTVIIGHLLHLIPFSTE